MHEKVVKYLKALELINEAERDDEKGSEPTEKIGIAYEKPEAIRDDDAGNRSSQSSDVDFNVVFNRWKRIVVVM